jgi:glycosyltransferase involved in cell wall biosynthesis
MVAPVSVCLIVRDEIDQIENCLRSIRPYVEEICIVDTGSTDGTLEVVKKYADKWESYSGCNDSDGRIADFADARNRSFSLASKNWVLWVDGDDEVKNAEALEGIIKKYDDLSRNKLVVAMFPYEYSHDHHGNVNCYLYRERLISNKRSMRWVGQVHEVMIPDHEVGSEFIKLDDVIIVHRRDDKKKKPSTDRNLRILKDMYSKSGDSDVRTLHYLALEHGYVNNFGEAIRLHKRYIELSGWDDEKYSSYLKIADHYHKMDSIDDAIHWALSATLVKEEWGEAYFLLGKCYYTLAQKGGKDEEKNWKKSINFINLGLGCKPTDTILFIDQTERNYGIHYYLNFALHKIGRTLEALESVNKALAFVPHDPMLLKNKELYEVHLKKVELTKIVKDLVRMGQISDEQEDLIQSIVNKEIAQARHERIQSMIQSITFGVTAGGADLLVSDEPDTEDQCEHVQNVNYSINSGTASGGIGPRVFDDPDIDNTKSETPVIEVMSHESVCKDVVFYVGHGLERWSPDTVKRTGIGGSELAVIEMSKRLKQFGKRVRVYGDCSGLEGEYDGVEYFNYSEFKDVECDAFITSRRPHVMDDSFGLKSRVSICWVHDVHLGPELTHARALRIDKFLCLSNWHRDFFLSRHGNVHQSQVKVTRNGIDTSRFNKAIIRNNRRVMYTSSPDRGLPVLLSVWPSIREQVPDAELHIFYGFENWEKSATMAGDGGQLSLISKLKKDLSALKSDGVQYHGRVDQNQLSDEFLKSGVWAYPTWFSETSCISAMEAQAAGLEIVTSPIAALNETVGPRGHMINGDWLSPDYQFNFVASVVDSILLPKDREQRMEYARENFGWDSLAKEWDLMFDDVIKEVGQNILPPYKGAF